ncbi:hypothetical protein C8R45DRAFT_1097998 [Mycena sanguinolenta]|nr:hypothetical protein C8R45DRAFT_1097998 [Mycena sanguinolenta]
MDPVLTSRVTSFSIIRHDDHMNRIWFLLLSRDTLREFKVFKPISLARPEVQPFPNVHTLRTIGLPDMIHSVEILSKFPNLLSFSISHGDILRNLTPAQELSIFPVLKEYSVNHLNLHIFAQRATLTHITLLSDLANELQDISVLPNITFLAVQFITSESDRTNAEIETLFSFFPNLTKLQLSLIPTEHGELLTRRMTIFLKTLPSNPLLPSTLHSVSLKWDFSRYSNSRSEMAYDLASPLLADITDFGVLRAELIAKCPALTCILLDRYHFLFLWWKTSSVWEATAYTFKTRRPFGTSCQNTARKYDSYTLPIGLFAIVSVNILNET